MLQPMQPTGQQQKPGTNMPQGAPQRAPGQQMMPAGAAMQQGILPGGIASNPEDIKAAYGGTPQGQQKLAQARDKGDYLSAIALSQILEEEREKAAAKAAQINQGGKPPPVMDRMREEAVDLRRQDLEEQQAKRLGMEQQRSQGAMAQMVQQAARPPMQGISQLPAPNVAQPRAMAAGGIVAFAKGGGMPVEVEEKVTEEEVRPVGANPYSGMKPRAMGMKYATEQLGADRAAEERRAREEYLKFAGYTPEEKARQEKRIADMEAYDKEAYGPDRISSDRLFYALAGARGANPSETLSNYGIGSINYGNKMRELVRQRMADRQKQAETWDEAQRGARVKGYDSGIAAGKETLQGQRTGATVLGDILQADASMANAALRSSGSSAGAGNKATEDASQAAARDETIGSIKKYIIENSIEPGTPEFSKYSRMIEDRKKVIYASFPGAIYPNVPEMALPEEIKKKDEGTGIMAGLKNLWSGVKSGAQQAQSGQLGQQPQQPGLPPGAKWTGGYAKGTTKKVYETPDGQKFVEQ